MKKGKSMLVQSKPRIKPHVCEKEKFRRETYLPDIDKLYAELGKYNKVQLIFRSIVDFSSHSELPKNFKKIILKISS